MNKRQLIKLIEMAYYAASEAKISKWPMVVQETEDGRVMMNEVRMTTYIHVLASIIPKPQTVKHIPPPDPYAESFKDD